MVIVFQHKFADGLVKKTAIEEQATKFEAAEDCRVQARLRYIKWKFICFFFCLIHEVFMFTLLTSSIRCEKINLMELQRLSLIYFTKTTDFMKVV